MPSNSKRMLWSLGMVLLIPVAGLGCRGAGNHSASGCGSGGGCGSCGGGAGRQEMPVSSEFRSDWATAVDGAPAVRAPLNRPNRPTAR